jgi:GMP synthase-like glutamine amidotransferase
MHLAILMTNTDDSEFSQDHPGDGQKFSDLIHMTRPDWTLEVFAVKDGIIPDDLTRFDGVMITGSPASAQSDAPWVAQLLELIRQMHADRLPMFGACFGHQAIALALGGRLGRNPGGWVHGLTRNSMVARPDWVHDLPDEVKLYGSHIEQVSHLPKGAEVISCAPGCDISGFVLGGHIYTTQHHPEMTPDFIAALTDELAELIGPEVSKQARASLAEPADRQAYATSIARFFEQAVS